MSLGEISFFMLFQMYSMGFRSGEYGGRNTRWMFSSWAFSLVALAQCDLKLSRMSMMGLSGFASLIFSRNSQTHSFLEFSLKSSTFSPFMV